MGLQFCKVSFSVESRVLTDASGNVIPEYPLRPGSILVQWADVARATGWIREAYRLLNDQARIAALDAPINRQNVSVNQQQAKAQFQYVLEIMSAIAHAYNLLNLVWWNDPIARMLYRRYVAGPPVIENIGSTNTSNRALFEEPTDYNPAWYSGDRPFPGIRRQDGNTGLLQTEALNILERVGAKNGVPFAISVMILMGPTTPLRPGQSVESANAVYNLPAVRTKLTQVCAMGIPSQISSAVGMPMGGNFGSLGSAFGAIGAGVTYRSNSEVDFPWNVQCREGSKTIGNSLPDFSIGFSPSIHTVLPDGTQLNNEFDDWRAAYYGYIYNGWTGAVTMAPLRSYLGWLRLWVDSLVKRSAQQIIQDVRAFTVYQNAMTINYNGATVQQAWNAIAGSSADIYAQKHARSAEATIASGFLGAAAGIAATVPGYGTIVAAVLGAAAVVVNLVDSLSIKGVKGHGRDDLGRYKLQFERAWLSGDPAAPDPQTGAPILPQSETYDPPGKGTSWTELATIDEKPVCPVYLTTPQVGQSSGFGWIAATAVIAAGVGYWYLKRKRKI